MKRKNKIKHSDIVKALIFIIFILIGLMDILIIKRIEKLEKTINETDSKCLRYYESALEILK